MRTTITLYTMAWNGYWEKYSNSWSKCVNSFNTVPDEIIIVSDEELDLSDISITHNVKNIIGQCPDGERPMSYYKNLAVQEASSDWVVAYDLDDEAFPEYLDNFNDSSDIHAFSYIHDSVLRKPGENSLSNRLSGVGDPNVIPGTSAIKKDFFKNIRYENDCYEDKVFYSMAYFLNPKVTFDDAPRFNYSGFHSESSELKKTSRIYQNMLTKKERPLYVCWFSETMSENRKSALDILLASCKVDIKLITLENFYDYESKKIPIHPGFKFLTDTDKSDYARAYLMYFYGGGYSDIKANSFDWNPYFDELLSSPYDAIGHAEQSPNDVAKFWGDDDAVENYVKNNFGMFAGANLFIFKPRTRFAYDWIMEIHKLMDENYDQLKNNPGVHPYMVKGGFHSGWHGDVPAELVGHGYPFKWTDVGGTTRHRLEYEYGLNVFKKGMPLPNTNMYR